MEVAHEMKQMVCKREFLFQESDEYLTRTRQTKNTIPLLEVNFRLSLLYWQDLILQCWNL